MVPKLFSIGLRSGEYGGRKSKVAPAFRMRFRVVLDLWKAALSITTTMFELSSGQSSSASHALNTALLQVPSNSMGAASARPIRAAMSEVRGRR